MVPKTERFELRLDTDLMARIDEWRSKQDDFPSRSEAVRRLVEKGLVNEAALSPGDRLITTMLCDIYEHLKVRKDIEPDFVRRAVLDGHFWALEMRYPSVMQTTPISYPIVQETIAILNMWDFIRIAYSRMTEEEKCYVKDNVKRFKEPVVFPGFDGNNDVKHYSVAHFFVNEMGRFQSLFDKNINLDSHDMTSLPRYRKMLDVFTPMWKNLMGETLNKEQLVQILEASYQGINS